MKIPKYVDDALKKRLRYALILEKQCYIVDRFLLENGIECDEACFLTGVEIYVNPAAAEQAVRKAIEEHEDGKI